MKNHPDSEACTITILSGQETTGSDEGVAYFEDGALIFEGLYTNFKLFPVDVLWMDQGDAFVKALQETGSQRSYGDLALKDVNGFFLAAHPTYSLYISALYTKGKDLGAEMYKWLRQNNKATGDSVLPPLEQQEGYHPKAFL